MTMIQYDNDTEAPTIEDACIDSMADPDLQLLAVTSQVD